MLRIDTYDRIIGFHPYRTSQPWDLGGTRVLHIDAANGSAENRLVLRGEVMELENQLLQRAKEDGLQNVERDNHYGFTLEADRGFDLPKEGLRVPKVRWQIRFSDGSMTLWLMPDSYGASITP